MTTTASRRFEIGALILIALLVLFGGRILIHALAGFRLPAALVIAVALVAGTLATTLMLAVLKRPLPAASALAAAT